MAFWTWLTSGAADTVTTLGAAAITDGPLAVAAGVWAAMGLLEPRRMFGLLGDDSSELWSNLPEGGGTRSWDDGDCELTRSSGEVASALSSSMMTMFLGISLNW